LTLAVLTARVKKGSRPGSVLKNWRLVKLKIKNGGRATVKEFLKNIIF
jgi:hypothetical protein